MGKNKTQKNGLTMYISETLRPELERMGQRFRGMHDIIPIALERYKMLSPAEKERYEQMAKEFKAQNRGKQEDLQRRDNMGNVIATRVDVAAELSNKRLNDRKDIKDALQTARDVLDLKFYFIDFQLLVRTGSTVEDFEYLPIELGIVEWNMSSGITETRHTFINPGSIPLGYRFKAKEQSELTHQIPLESYSSMGVNEYDVLWHGLEIFINPHRTPYHPPIYCMKEDYNKVMGCIEWLYVKSGASRYSRNQNCPINVHYAEDLVHVLCANKNMGVSEASVLDILSVGTYDYDSESKCEYHKDQDTKYCSLGFAKRITYALSDSLANIYSFALTPAHLPSAVQEKEPVVAAISAGFQFGGGFDDSSVSNKSRGRGQSNSTQRPRVDNRQDSVFASRDIRYKSEQQGQFRSISDRNETGNDDEEDGSDDSISIGTRFGKSAYSSKPASLAGSVAGMGSDGLGSFQRCSTDAFSRVQSSTIQPAQYTLDSLTAASASQQRLKSLAAASNERHQLTASANQQLPQARSVGRGRSALLTQPAARNPGTSMIQQLSYSTAAASNTAAAPCQLVTNDPSDFPALSKSTTSQSASQHFPSVSSDTASSISAGRVGGGSTAGAWSNTASTIPAGRVGGGSTAGAWSNTASTIPAGRVGGAWSGAVGGSTAGAESTQESETDLESTDVESLASDISSMRTTTSAQSLSLGRPLAGFGRGLLLGGQPMPTFGRGNFVPPPGFSVPANPGEQNMAAGRGQAQDQIRPGVRPPPGFVKPPPGFGS